MGTSRSTDELVGKIVLYGSTLAIANRKATSAATLRYKEKAIQNLEADTGGDRRMSNFKGGRFRMGAGYRLFGDINAKAVLKPRPYGMWALLDGGSEQHEITPKRRRRGGRARALKIPGSPSGFAAYADHRGSTGKGTFRKVPAQAERAAKRSFQRSHAAALADAFK